MTGERPLRKLFTKEQRAFLAERGVDLTGEQQTKTQTALRYFSQQAAGPGSPGDR